MGVGQAGDLLRTADADGAAEDALHVIRDVLELRAATREHHLAADGAGEAEALQRLENDRGRLVSERVLQLRAREEAAGYRKIETYTRFEQQVRETKRKLLELVIEAKRAGKRIAGYGAPGKGNTLLNYCGIRTDFLEYAVDRNPYKHGRFTPGTHIPIFPPERIAETRPDYVLILPWNLKNEIMAQLAYIREWGGQFVCAVPALVVQ